MAKSTGTNLPHDTIRRTFMGRLVFAPWRGQIVVKAWPRKRGPHGTPAQMEARADFTKMARAVADMMVEDKVGAMELAKGTALTWRDVLSQYVTGAPFTFPGMQMITTQAALDVLSEIVGAVLVRGTDGWYGLVPGPDGDFLTTHGIGEVPTWEPPPEAPASALSLISTQTASNSATIAWTGLAASRNWQLRGGLILPASNAVDLRLQIATGTGPTYKTTGYDWALNYSNTGGTGGYSGGANQSQIVIQGSASNAGAGNSAMLDIVTDNASFFRIHGTVTSKSSDGNYYRLSLGGGGAIAAPITAIKVYFSTGNIASGFAGLYSLAT